MRGATVGPTWVRLSQSRQGSPPKPQERPRPFQRGATTLRCLISGEWRSDPFRGAVDPCLPSLTGMHAHHGNLGHEIGGQLISTMRFLIGVVPQATTTCSEPTQIGHFISVSRCSALDAHTSTPKIAVIAQSIAGTGTVSWINGRHVPWRDPSKRLCQVKVRFRASWRSAVGP